VTISYRVFLSRAALSMHCINGALYIACMGTQCV